MLIRSQDKQKLVSMDGVLYMEIENSEDGKCLIWAVGSDDSAISIGTYSTQEKALAVMDEIIYAFQCNEDTKYFGANGAHIRSSVFQMPADDDPWFEHIKSGEGE